MQINPELIKQLLNLQTKYLWIDFDKDGDVIYISFDQPQNANDSILDDDGTIRHYRDEQLTGITITNATSYLG